MSRLSISTTSTCGETAATRSIAAPACRPSSPTRSARYYRFDVDAAINFTSQDLFVSSANQFQNFEDIFGSLSFNFVGDTVRYQRFGPYQGKRLNVGASFAPHISGDLPGDIVQYNLDYRGYKKVTRRSLLAFRIGSIYNNGDRAISYGFGGLNQLRGYEFREFLGSRLAYSNLEFRYPLIDRLDFPVFPLGQIRGFFFFDVGGAWNLDDSWYDPTLGTVRFDPALGETINFDAWDSENDRLQDLRASYGAGFQFIFIGGLQFNWAWAKRLEYTQFCQVSDPINCTLSNNTDPVTGRLEKRLVDPDWDLQFYIAYDW